MILMHRHSTYGSIFINGIETVILERFIVDIYYLLTRDGFPFPLEAFKDILVNAVAAGEFNFSFARRYSRMRTMDFEFDMILSALAREFPGSVSMKPTFRIKNFLDVMQSLFGERWWDRVVP